MENNKKPDVNFVWKITDDVLRDTFKKNEIGDVILPFVVIRRIDCILKPYNEAVRKNYEQFKDKIADQNLEKVLFKAAGGKKFYNTSKHTLVTLLDDARNCEINFKNYLNGFNKEVRDILTNFQFDKVIAKLIRNNLLYQMIQEICELDFSPEKIDNHDMGYIFEELIRISNENSNETAGEHFTPRDVIRLMSAILFTPDKDTLNRSGIIRTIYDPACGTGGMVNVGKNFILENICTEGNTPTIRTYGQELNEQSYAIAKSEALITGENADNIKLGNSFTQDQFKTNRFHYIMANPPYGVTWKKDQEFILNESLNPDGRFYAGTPRSTDGQLLFVQHMISKMEPDGARIGVVTNGSPLFIGGAGSGESNIRKWIIENDWLECIIALPKDLFYNTGIFTYIWFITNKKSEVRKGKVQLINAIDFCSPASKSLGNKRNDIKQEHINQILDLYLRFEENKYSRIFDNSFFGSLQLTIEQPLRDNNGELVYRKGAVVPNPNKRSIESVPLSEDYDEYFSTIILPQIDPESWIDYSKTRLNFEINFTKYFYEIEYSRPSAEVVKDIFTQISRVKPFIDRIEPLSSVEGQAAPDASRKVDWFGSIPATWRMAKLNYICDNITDGSHFSPQTVEEGLPYVTVSDVYDDKVHVEGASKISEKDYNALVASGCKPPKGSVLLAKDGTVGRTAIVEDNDYVVLSSLGILTPGKDITSKYLKYLLDSTPMQEQMKMSMAGAALRRITLSKITDFIGLVPPIKEQEAICDNLDNTIPKIDEIIDSLQSIMNLLKEYKKSIVNDSVTGK